jgi:hypothetical protein
MLAMIVGFFSGFPDNTGIDCLRSNPNNLEHGYSSPGTILRELALQLRRERVKLMKAS